MDTPEAAHDAGTAQHRCKKQVRLYTWVVPFRGRETKFVCRECGRIWDEATTTGSGHYRAAHPEEVEMVRVLLGYAEQRISWISIL